MPPVTAPGGRTFHFTFVTGPPSYHRMAKNLGFILAGAAAALAYISFRKRRNRRRPASHSLADAGVGTDVLETRAAVDRLLQQYFGRPEEVLPELFASSAPHREALDFAFRLGVLCERHCDALRDFTGEYGDPTALDLGCGVGAFSFELSHAFRRVVGLDTSKAYINAAKTLKERGWMRYTSINEGDLTEEHSAVLPDDIETDRVNFAAVSNLASIPKEFAGPYDAVLAANVLCRLPDPAAFIKQLPRLVIQGGVVVLASSYDWMETCTPRSSWLGGYKTQAGEAKTSKEALQTLMETHFKLVAEEDLPFLVKEHARRFSLGVCHTTVWKRW